MCLSHKLVDSFVFLALPLQFFVGACVVSFKVFVGELYFGEFRCRNSDAFSPIVFQSLIKWVNLVWGREIEEKNLRLTEQDRSSG